MIELIGNEGAQDAFLRSEDQYPALIGGLGSGKTWGGSAWVTLEHLKWPGTDSMVVEPTHSLLREVAIPALCERLEYCDVEHEVVLTASIMAILTPELDSKILLRSATRAEYITGFEVGRTWIDEPAKMPEHTDPKRNVWLACLGRTRAPAVPVDQRRIGVTGTHEGKGTWFHRLWERKPGPGYAIYRAATGDNPSAAAQVAIYLREFGPELSEQYVRGFAVESSLAAVPYAVLEGLQDGEAKEADLAALRTVAGPLDVGVDIGRSKSLTVFWVVRAAGDGKLITEAVIVLKSTAFAEQFEVIKTLVGLPGFSRMAIDATYNPQTAEDAVQAFGENVIERVIFTAASKRAITQHWIKACQTGRLRIPASEDILMDFFSVKRVVSSLGDVTYQAPFTADGHADRASACSLAVWASRRGPQEVSFIPGPDLRATSMKGL